MPCFDARVSTFFVAFRLGAVYLLHLGLHLSLRLCFVHALADKNIHEEHLLLLVWNATFRRDLLRLAVDSHSIRLAAASSSCSRWSHSFSFSSSAADVLRGALLSFSVSCILSWAWFGIALVHLLLLGRRCGMLFAISISLFDLLTRLVAVIYYKRWLINIQVRRSRRVIEVCSSIGTSTVGAVSRASDCTYHVSTALQSLLYLLLVLLADEILNLLLGLRLSLRARPTRVLLLLLLHQHHVDLPSLSLLLHFLILSEQLLLEVVILLLLRARVFLLLWSIPWDDIRCSSLQLVFDRGQLPNLLLLQLFDLFLNGHLILMILVHLSAVDDRLGAVAAHLWFALALWLLLGWVIVIKLWIVLNLICAPSIHNLAWRVRLVLRRWLVVGGMRVHCWCGKDRFWTCAVLSICCLMVAEVTYSNTLGFVFVHWKILLVQVLNPWFMVIRF